MPQYYECDYIKNKDCPKTSCSSNGGPCHLTTNPKFEKKESNKKKSKKVEKNDKS